MEINCEFVTKVLTKFIREELNKFGYRKGIIGLSGGLDSATSAYLAVRALGKDNLTCLILPYGKSFEQDVADAIETARRLGVAVRTINISPMIDIYYKDNPTENRILRGNKMARERMSVLYDYSEREKALIIGTSNKTELLLGYGTIHGDMACAINPMGDLYKTQVRILARHLGVPEKVLAKTPTAGLWPGQTDEDELGLTYEKIDSILYLLIDKQLSKKEIAAEGFEIRDIEKIAGLIAGSEFKRKLPPIPKLSERTVGHDFLYPFDRGR